MKKKEEIEEQRKEIDEEKKKVLENSTYFKKAPKYEPPEVEYEKFE
jgi:hypothetical protein